MAQEDVAQRRCVDAGQIFGRDFIVEMPVVRADAGLEIFGIGAGGQHGRIVVGLNHEVVGFAHVEVGAFGDAAQICSHHYVVRSVGDVVSGIVGAVVHHLECQQREVADGERVFLVYGVVIVLDAVGDGMAAKQAVERTWRAEHLHVAVFAQKGVDVAHVIAVVVCKGYPLHGFHVYAVAVQLVDNMHHVHSRIDEESRCIVAEVGAVARTSGAERDEFQTVDGWECFKRRECVAVVEQHPFPFLLFGGETSFRLLLNGRVHRKIVGAREQRVVEVVEQPRHPGLYGRTFLVACHCLRLLFFCVGLVGLVRQV